MPNQPKTLLRSFRAGVEYEIAREIAKARGENLSKDVLRPALLAYISAYGQKEEET